MAASMDQALTDFRQQKMDALRDPSHPFHRAPDSFWDDTLRKMQAVRICAGLAAAVAPKTPQQVAQEQHAASFSLPGQINPNMGELFDNALADLAKNPDKRDAQAADLRKTLGPVAYSELLVSAELGRGAQVMANVDYRDGFLVQGASATQGPFVLLGGKYGVSCSATFGGGSVALQTLGPDAATFVTVANFTANGATSVDLPAGKYQVSVVTATAVNLACVPISYRK